jgi:hypothetical protein
MHLPTNLYKYEPFTAQALQNLKSQAIYFGSPKNFNDPYDCALFPRVKNPSDEEIERIRFTYLQKKDLPKNVRQQFLNTSPDGLRSILARIAEDVFNDVVKTFLDKRGVTCFSERHDSLLMWGHYGGRFCGFCLEFRTDIDLFSKARSVTYSQSMPEIEIAPLLCDENYDQVLDLYCTKAEDWKYEREWRCLHNEAGTVYHYPAEAITGVYIGPDAPLASLEIIALILSGQNPGVQIWRGRRSRSAFSVEFDSVSYTSHTDAKRQGLIP